MKKSKHMTKVYIKYCLAYCISIDVQMMYTLCKYMDIHHAYVFLYDCMRSESESESHSSPPQLKGVRVISECVRVCVLTAVVHAHKSGQTKNRYGHTH